MVELPPVSSSFMAYVSPAVDMTIEQIAWSWLPGTYIPRSAASLGTTTGADRPPEPAMVIAFDFPEQKTAAVTKPLQEIRDVDAFLHDVLPAGRVTSPSIVNPHDPPDVLAYVDGNEVGIEAAQFLPPDSELDKSNSIVGRWEAFERFRNKVLDLGPNSLRQHRGLLTVMHFGRSSATRAQRLPPKRANLGSAIAALRTAEPIVREGTEAAAPNLHESDVIRWSSDGSVFFAWTRLPPWYTSPFHARMGFELALGYHATLTRSDLRAELGRIIQDHDSDKTVALVVTVNAPLRSGLEFPINGLIAQMLFDDEQPLDGWAPPGIENVALHDQSGHRVKWIVGSYPWG